MEAPGGLGESCKGRDSVVGFFLQCELHQRNNDTIPRRTPSLQQTLQFIKNRDRNVALGVAGYQKELPPTPLWGIDPDGDLS